MQYNLMNFCKQRPPVKQKCTRLVFPPGIHPQTRHDDIPLIIGNPNNPRPCPDLRVPSASSYQCLILICRLDPVEWRLARGVSSCSSLGWPAGWPDLYLGGQEFRM